MYVKNIYVQLNIKKKEWEIIHESIISRNISVWYSKLKWLFVEPINRLGYYNFSLRKKSLGEWNLF